MSSTFLLHYIDIYSDIILIEILWYLNLADCELFGQLVTVCNKNKQKTNLCAILI